MKVEFYMTIFNILNLKSNIGVSFFNKVLLDLIFKTSFLYFILLNFILL